MLQGNVEVVLATTPTLRIQKQTATNSTSNSTGGVSQEDLEKIKNLQEEVDSLSKVAVGAIVVVAVSLVSNIIALLVILRGK